MNKTILILLASLFLSLQASAQGFYPLQIGNLWEYWERTPSIYAGQWRLVGDTTMPNGQTYRYHRFDNGGAGEFLRQVGPVVYKYLTTFPQEEVIAYDFSKTTGDTVTIRYYPNDTVIVTVVRDGYVSVFGRLLRQWEFYERSIHSSVYAVYEK